MAVVVIESEKMYMFEKFTSSSVGRKVTQNSMFWSALSKCSTVPSFMTLVIIVSEKCLRFSIRYRRLDDGRLKVIT